MIFITLALSLCFNSLVESKVEGRIIGGRYTDAAQHKPLVRILAGGFMCGGSLISKHAVLTAAHCAPSLHPSGYVINEGKTTQREMDQPNSSRLTATSVHVHEQYNPQTVFADVAVILVDPNHQMSSPLAIDTSNMAKLGNRLRFAGWGHEEFKGQPSPHLKSLSVRVVQDQVCRIFETYDPNSHFCANSGYDGNSICQGDSGSPLVSSDGRTVVGIASYVYKGCKAGPEAYTKVFQYSGWIKRIVDQGPSSKPNKKQIPGYPHNPQSPQQQPQNPKYPQNPHTPQQEPQFPGYPQQQLPDQPQSQFPGYPQYLQFPGYNQNPWNENPGYQQFPQSDPYYGYV